jgi:predicted O-linked N-acetylglucosamine transferase (SPINDLY family)
MTQRALRATWKMRCMACGKKENMFNRIKAAFSNAGKVGNAAAPSDGGRKSGSMVEIVSATRLSEAEFWRSSALGTSLRRLAPDVRIAAHIAFENRLGLPDIFNARIRSDDAGQILVFMHDDVWIDEIAFVDRLLEGFMSFDVIGIAGNRRRVKRQPAWAFIDDKLTWDAMTNLSGCTAHGDDPFGEVSAFGPAPADCELLDGVFLAAAKSTLTLKQIQFDPRFDFHFYDMDFCRSARAKGLRLGTWPLALTHQSRGMFESPAWVEKFSLYLEKWESSEEGDPSHVSNQASGAGVAGPGWKPVVSDSFVTASDRGIRGELIQTNMAEARAGFKGQGDGLLARGHWAEAALYYGRALAIDADYAEACVNLGYALNELGEREQAQRHLERAIAIDAGAAVAADAFYILGTMCRDQGRQAEAIAHFRQALALRPDFQVVYHDLSQAYLQSGQTENAKATLAEAISRFAGEADFHFRLGSLHVPAKEFERAAESFQKALAVRPDHAEAHNSLGFVLQAQGKLEAAIESYREALALNPDNFDALNNCGIALQALTRHQEALDCHERALRLKPDSLDVYRSIGSLLHLLGRLDAATETFRKAVSLQPDNAEAHNNLGVMLQAGGELASATDSYRRALALKPDFADAHVNLGSAFQKQHKPEDALACYRDALRCNPDFPDAHLNMGVVLQSQGKLAEAVDAYRRVMVLDPQLPEAYANLGSVLQAQRKLDEAIPNFRKVVQLTPQSAQAHFNLGSALYHRGELDEAIDCYNQALLLNPDMADAHVNLGSALQGKCRLQDAIRHYRRAIELRPDFLLPGSNVLFAMSFDPSGSPAAYREEAISFGQRALQQARPYTDWPSMRVPLPRADSGPKLRVGLVSGDLNNHPVSFFLENILAHLDTARIELIAYATQPYEDELTARLKPRFVAWRAIGGITDEAAARQIQEDGIHVLVDLAGHSNHNRLPLFAWKPAPVQVSWLGYLASTGVPGMDYLLADPVSVPEQNRAHFTEHIWYLPDSLNCFTPPKASGPLGVALLPALRNGFVTFGCFQNLAKVDDIALAAWGRVFEALPSARLRLQMKQMSQASAREDILKRLARAGITAERVSLAGPVGDREQYLATHGEVDIVLDTFPYPGITTTCEALWMGVPTVTLAGNTLLSRQGAALLTCVGLEDWIGADEDGYVACAVRHASDLERLSQLRATLRERALASPLFDVPRFARHLGQAWFGMLEKKASAST